MTDADHESEPRASPDMKLEDLENHLCKLSNATIYDMLFNYKQAGCAPRSGAPSSIVDAQACHRANARWHCTPPTPPHAGGDAPNGKGARCAPSEQGHAARAPSSIIDARACSAAWTNPNHPHEEGVHLTDRRVMRAILTGLRCSARARFYFLPTE